MEERCLPIGTKVFDIRFGWGKVSEYHRFESDDEYINDPTTYLIATFGEQKNVCYYRNGSFPSNDHNHEHSYESKELLSLTEYNYKDGGFTPLSDFEFEKVGDCGYFWNEKEYKTHYSMIKEVIKPKGYICINNNHWDNFSEEDIVFGM